MSSRGGRTGTVGVVFQDEVYIQRVPPVARRILAGFGIVFGTENVAIYIEPRAGSGVDIRADTARSRILLNGEDVEEANWWDVWGAEFKDKMPAPIKAHIDAILAKTETDPEGKTRERILERLKRIKALLRPSRYRKEPSGDVRADGPVHGGAPQQSERTPSGTGGTAGTRGGRASDQYLAEIVELEGHLATEVEIKPPAEPRVTWVSRADGTREEDDLEDVAAELVGDVLRSDLIKANADFRGYRDLLNIFEEEFNPMRDEAITRKIVELVREWMEFQLVEVVMTTRNLENGRTWTRKELELALSQQALTCVLMSRFHVVEKVKRSLGSELARPAAKVA